MRVKDAVGRFGEDLAAAHLTQAGLEVLDRNWRCREGELDLVAREGDELVFVEVKTRSSAAFGDPAEAVTRAKMARLRRLAVRWVLDHRETWLRARPELRFDVVSVIRQPSGDPVVRHIRSAF
jgi:putative endonuclease